MVGPLLRWHALSGCKSDTARTRPWQQSVVQVVPIVMGSLLAHRCAVGTVCKHRLAGLVPRCSRTLSGTTSGCNAVQLGALATPPGAGGWTWPNPPFSQARRQHLPWPRTCSRRMSVDAATWSSRLLIFFSLWLRVTAARVYSSICLRRHGSRFRFARCCASPAWLVELAVDFSLWLSVNRRARVLQHLPAQLHSHTRGY